MRRLERARRPGTPADGCNLIRGRILTNMTEFRNKCPGRVSDTFAVMMDREDAQMQPARPSLCNVCVNTWPVESHGCLVRVRLLLCRGQQASAQAGI